MKKEIYIYGHKSPDTDSICSAISVAYLKNRMAKIALEDADKFWGRVEKEGVYLPMAAGDINSETAYVLKKFGVDAPEINTDIRRQIKDIDIKKVPVVNGETSIKDAWEDMHEVNAYTIPVTDEKDGIQGIITVGDITRAYMDVCNKAYLSEAKTPLTNIVGILSGKLVAGDVNGCVENGVIHIAAANASLVDVHIKEGDIAILCDDEENQRLLIDKKISCMIICNGVDVAEEIVKLAEANGVAIVATKEDTYQVARLINQSIPVKHFMKPVEDICGFEEDDFVEDIKDEMIEKRYRDFPVFNKDGEFEGMITRSSLVDMKSKKVILVDHNELSQAVFGLFDAEVLEIIDHHKLGTVETMQPISVTNKPVGCTATIVYQMYKECGIDIPKNIGGIMCSAILSDTMCFKSPTCTEEDKKAAMKLADDCDIDIEQLWAEMLRASLDLDSKTEKDIFYQDYKHFTAGGITFGAGQVLAASAEDVESVKSRMKPYLETALKEEGIDMVCLMITNVTDESTELIFKGENAVSIVESAFAGEAKDESIYLKGVVSRKKQLIPPIMAVLQQ